MWPQTAVLLASLAVLLVPIGFLVTHPGRKQSLKDREAGLRALIGTADHLKAIQEGMGEVRKGLGLVAESLALTPDEKVRAMILEVEELKAQVSLLPATWEEISDKIRASEERTRKRISRAAQERREHEDEGEWDPDALAALRAAAEASEDGGGLPALPESPNGAPAAVDFDDPPGEPGLARARQLANQRR